MTRLPRPDIDPNVFFTIDMRVGRVLHATPFAAARRPALRVTVDFGADVGVLETSAQIANYPVDSLVGSLVVGVINLGPKRIADLESQFLLLAAVEDDHGTPYLVRPDEGAKPGDRVM